MLLAELVRMLHSTSALKHQQKLNKALLSVINNKQQIFETLMNKRNTDCHT